MEEAHKDLIEKKGLNQYHWGLVAGHLVSSLEDLSVPQTLIDEVVAVVGTTKSVSHFFFLQWNLSLLQDFSSSQR